MPVNYGSDSEEDDDLPPRKRQCQGPTEDPEPSREPPKEKAQATQATPAPAAPSPSPAPPGPSVIVGPPQPHLVGPPQGLPPPAFHHQHTLHTPPGWHPPGPPHMPLHPHYRHHHGPCPQAPAPHFPALQPQQHQPPPQHPHPPHLRPHLQPQSQPQPQPAQPQIQQPQPTQPQVTQPQAQPKAQSPAKLMPKPKPKPKKQNDGGDTAQANTTQTPTVTPLPTLLPPPPKDHAPAGFLPTKEIKADFGPKKVNKGTISGITRTQSFQAGQPIRPEMAITPQLQERFVQSKESIIAALAAQEQQKQRLQQQQARGLVPPKVQIDLAAPRTVSTPRQAAAAAAALPGSGGTLEGIIGLLGLRQGSANTNTNVSANANAGNGPNSGAKDLAGLLKQVQGLGLADILKLAGAKKAAPPAQEDELPAYTNTHAHGPSANATGTRSQAAAGLETEKLEQLALKLGIKIPTAPSNNRQQVARQLVEEEELEPPPWSQSDVRGTSHLPSRGSHFQSPPTSLGSNLSQAGGTSVRNFVARRPTTYYDELDDDMDFRDVRGEEEMVEEDEPQPTIRENQLKAQLAASILRRKQLEQQGLDDKGEEAAMAQAQKFQKLKLAYAQHPKKF